MPPFVESLNLEIETTQPLKNLADKLPKELPSIPIELECFRLPISPFLLTDRRYKAMHSSFMTARLKLADAISLIVRYDAEIVPMYRDLAILQVAEDRIRPRELELQKNDVLERAERIVRKQLAKENEQQLLRAEHRLNTAAIVQVQEEKPYVPLKSADERLETKSRVEAKMKRNLLKVR